MLRLARIAVGIASNTASVVPIAAIATIESEHREEKEPSLIRFGLHPPSRASSAASLASTVLASTLLTSP